jgi:hypothetical protein
MKGNEINILNYITGSKLMNELAIKNFKNFKKFKNLISN